MTYCPPQSCLLADLFGPALHSYLTYSCTPDYVFGNNSSLKWLFRQIKNPMIIIFYIDPFIIGSNGWLSYLRQYIIYNITSHYIVCLQNIFLQHFIIPGLNMSLIHTTYHRLNPWPLHTLHMFVLPIIPTKKCLVTPDLDLFCSISQGCLGVTGVLALVQQASSYC